MKLSGWFNSGKFLAGLIWKITILLFQNEALESMIQCEVSNTVENSIKCNKTLVIDHNIDKECDLIIISKWVSCEQQQLHFESSDDSIPSLKIKFKLSRFDYIAVDCSRIILLTAGILPTTPFTIHWIAKFRFVQFL